MNLTNDIVDYLKGVVAITSLIGQYNSEPAIFSAIPVPEAAPLPYIVAQTIVSDIHDDNSDQTNRIVTRDIQCFTKAQGSTVLVEQIAEAVRAALHRKDMPVVGFNTKLITCTGPIDVPTDVTIYGRLVTATFVLDEA